MELDRDRDRRGRRTGYGLLATYMSRFFAWRGIILILYASTVFAGGYHILTYVKEQLIAKRGAHLARTAAGMAQALDAFFLERVGELRVLAQHPGIRGVAPDAASGTLQRYVRLSESFGSVHILDAQGSVIAGSAPGAAGIPPRGWVRTMPRTGHPRVLSSRRAGTSLVTVSVPFDGLDGVMSGALSGTVPVQLVHQILQERYPVLAEGSQANAWLLADPQGIVITDQDGRGAYDVDLHHMDASAAAQASRTSAPQSGFVKEFDDHTQIAVVTGFARLAQHDPDRASGWTVLVRADRSAFYAPVNRVLWPVGVLFAVLAGIAGALGAGALQDLLKNALRQGREHRSPPGPTYYDVVTGLPGSRLFEMILGQAIERMSLTERTMALLMFDLKQLKIVSDSQGKAGKDLAVRVLAARVKSCIRMSDTVARVGTDRFAVLLENLSAPVDAASIAQKVLQTVVLPLTIASEEILIDTRIGIAMYPTDATAAKDLMARAEDAMATAQADAVPISFSSRTLGEQIFEGLAHASEAGPVPETVAFRS